MRLGAACACSRLPDLCADRLIHSQLTREVDKEAADAEEGEGEEMHHTSTTRSFVCEQQRLRVPATDAAATKMKDFRDQLGELSECHAASSNPSCTIIPCHNS